MLDWLKSTWAKWKVQISVVGGALVIASVYGTCTYEPVQEVSKTITNAETVPVNSTTVVNTATDNSENTTDNTEANSNDATNAADNTTNTTTDNVEANSENE